MSNVVILSPTKKMHREWYRQLGERRSSRAFVNLPRRLDLPDCAVACFHDIDPMQRYPSARRPCNQQKSTTQSTAGSYRNHSFEVSGTVGQPEYYGGEIRFHTKRLVTSTLSRIRLKDRESVLFSIL